MLGANSAFAREGREGSFIGADFDIDQDLSNELPERSQEFIQKFRPIWMGKHPGKSKIAAGLACSSLYMVSKGILEGDIVLCPNGSGEYWAGEVTGSYSYSPGTTLPHRRAVRWLPSTIRREAMSLELRNSTGSIGTVSTVTRHADEIKVLITGQNPPSLVATDETIEDPTVFALEKHLEDFLIKNWGNTELGRRYDIIEDDGGLIGQQYPTDTGQIDILATSKDKNELLVVELKKGRASDSVVGQIQRYMGYVLDELAEPHQTVKGVIIALEDDLRLRRALRVTKDIDFYTYQVSFKLTKQGQ